MRPIILDTHVLIWLFDGSPRLSDKVKSLIRQSCAASETFISAITPWEIAVLVAKSRVVLGKDIDSWMDKVFDDYGINLSPLSPAIAIESTRLPGNFHNDPSDRIIVATARALNGHLVTADRLILDYSASGHLHTISVN